MRRLIPMLALAVTMAVGVSASADEQKGGGTRKYLVTTTHTPEQCLAALDEMAQKNAKLLSTVEWGCKSGDHTGYVFITASSEQEALARLPEANRANAKAEQVTTFTPGQLKKIHASMAAAGK